MAFDLTKAAGLDKIVSNLDTMEITMVQTDLIDANDKNFFSVDDVQDLMESIQVNGILQPLNLVRAGDRYRIIAGHRRFKAAGLAGLTEVPAIILPEMSEAMEWFMLIKTNTTTRELSHAEKTEAAIRMKKHLVQMKQEGVKITGRLRDIVAEQMEISKTEMARMEVIDKGLSEDCKGLWKNNVIDASCAYELAKLPKDDQEALYSKMTRNGCRMSTPIVKDYVLQKKHRSWACQDCPYPSTPEEKEKRGKGWKFPCHHLEKLQIRHWSSNGSCMCCGNCDKAFKCLDACSGAKVAACEAHKYAEQKKNRKSEEDRMVQEMETLNASRIPNIAKSVLSLIDRGGIQMQDIAGWWTEKHRAMCPEYDLDEYEENDVAMMLYPQSIEDADFSLTSFIAFCDAIGWTPDCLLGYSDKSASGCWHPYPATNPRNGQRVVVRRTVGTITRCGEYIYRDGEWYEPGLDDFKMNITNVTHWIEAPEV